MAELKSLVVEDSPTMRQLLVYALKRIPGMVAIEAVDGVDAIKKLAIMGRPDVVLTDINMPIMDGFELIQRVRSDAASRDVPIIVITTEGGAEDRARALALGANAYITKPFQAPQVLQKVKELLSL